MSNSTFDTTAENIKDSVSEIASDMSERLGDVLGEAQRIIKENPAAALIGAVVIGFAAGRLLRRG
jgi:ElaB/YqjD/DUF883 family membrane-anchored ribosome-binding protein